MLPRQCVAQLGWTICETRESAASCLTVARREPLHQANKSQEPKEGELLNKAGDRPRRHRHFQPDQPIAGRLWNILSSEAGPVLDLMFIVMILV
jgi:hypothetical protein